MAGLIHMTRRSYYNIAPLRAVILQWLLQLWRNKLTTNKNKCGWPTVDVVSFHVYIHLFLYTACYKRDNTKTNRGNSICTVLSNFHGKLTARFYNMPITISSRADPRRTSMHATYGSFLLPNCMVIKLTNVNKSSVMVISWFQLHSFLLDSSSVAPLRTMTAFRKSFHTPI